MPRLLATLCTLLALVTSTASPALAQEVAEREPDPSIDPTLAVPRQKLHYIGRILPPSQNNIDFSVTFTPDGGSGWTGALTIDQQGIVSEPLHIETFDKQILQFRWEPSVLHESQYPVWLLQFNEVDDAGIPKKASGKFVQGGNLIDVVMEHREALEKGERARPQHPVEPFPYAVHDVAFESDEEGTFLSGTLTIPEGDGPFPAVFLLSGSGPQDRDSLIFGHRPFLVWADALTRRGVAVLRFDDRGFRRSQGDLATATTFTFAKDAAGAFRYLAQRPEIDPTRIGVLGHSEGAIVAALTQPYEGVDLACYALICGPAIPGLEVSARQATDNYRNARMPEEMLNDFDQKHRAALRAAGDGAPREELVQYLLEAIDVVTAPDLNMRESVMRRSAEQQSHTLVVPWTRAWMNLDPTTAYTRIDAPVIAVLGSLDMQVPPEHNLIPLRLALRESPSEDVTVHVFDGLNHLLQPAETGVVEEYIEIETTVAPDALEFVGDWIVDRLDARSE